MPKRPRDTAPAAGQVDEDQNEDRRKRLRNVLTAVEKYLERKWGKDWDIMDEKLRREYRWNLMEPYLATRKQIYNEKYNSDQRSDSPESATSSSDVNQQLTGERPTAEGKPYRIPKDVEVIDLTGDTPVKEHRREPTLKAAGVPDLTAEPSESSDGEMGQDRYEREDGDNKR